MEYAPLLVREYKMLGANFLICLYDSMLASELSEEEEKELRKVKRILTNMNLDKKVETLNRIRSPELRELYRSHFLEICSQ